MRYEYSVDVDATPAEVWAVLVDVERWPEWTASTTLVRRLDGGAFGVGSTARVKQPKLRAMVWRVTEFEPEVAFVWEATSGGVTTVAGHRIAAHTGTGEGADTGTGVRVTLDVTQRGPLAPLVGALAGPLTRRYVRTEAHGLKRRCETRKKG